MQARKLSVEDDMRPVLECLLEQGLSRKEAAQVLLLGCDFPVRPAFEGRCPEPTSTLSMQIKQAFC